jgi:hypothetical protein
MPASWRKESAEFMISVMEVNSISVNLFQHTVPGR